jgi:hypothetical protein
MNATRVLRWIGTTLAILAAAVVLMVIYNNYSFHSTSRAAFDAQSDHALDQAIGWIKDNAIYSERNPSMMYMIADMERMSHDPRLQAVLDHYQNHYLLHPTTTIEFVWHRLSTRNAEVPVIDVPDLHGEINETVWDAYAIAPDKVSISQEDQNSMFSPTKHTWGSRQHQLLALIMYRDYNGGSPQLDQTINQLAEKTARDAYFDFRVTDAYYQRTSFLLAAGRPDLVRPRWIDRILRHQNPDGSWDACWHGWCRGVFEFGDEVGSVGHSTVQAAWALAILKYRYPQWVEEHYP